ncbi:dityrosine transporter [Fusarium longipes]|uniref:Dityrosine transporter n=1 Tax=Fusarium longipes TaxID=694270 RepID=A0A395SFR8_9HYPO|nr:dityrosine transporter [Fusarium longipes]
MTLNTNPAPEAINRTSSHIFGNDAFEPPATIDTSEGNRSYREEGDEIFDKVSRGRKIAMVAVLSFGAFLAPISSTSMLAARAEQTALAPNLTTFIIFRAASAFGGTAFILVGPACIGDIYRPTERGVAMGWFPTGTLVGPAFGPFLGGIVVTYSSWRSIFWLQTALAAMNGLKTLSGRECALEILSMVNPMRIRFQPAFQSRISARLGPILPGTGFGYLAGTFMGGHWADYTAKRWIKKRGVRVPQDRLRSTLPFMSAIIPGSMLVYGWAVDQQAGGIPIPVIAMFIQGVAQLFRFPSYNTYCLDVMPGQGSEVAATNFFARYLVGCAASAVVLPAVEAVGIGWFSTISAAYLMVSALATMTAIRWGKGWRERIEVKLGDPREK